MAQPFTPQPPLHSSLISLLIKAWNTRDQFAHYLFHPRVKLKITRCGKRLQKTIENGPVEIMDFPIKHGGSFDSYVTVYQRVVNPSGS